MRIVDATASGLSRTFTIELDAGWVDATFNAQLERVGRTTRVRGFRAGKAPVGVLRARLGTQLTQDVVDQLAVTVSRKLIQEGQLRPVSRPVIEALSGLQKGQFQFNLIIEVLPDVTLRPLEGLTIQRLTAMPGSSDLSWLHVKRQVLDWLASHYDFEVPGTMVEREFSRILKSHADHVDMPVDHPLKLRYREVAQRRVRLAIVLLQLGKAHNVEMARGEIGQLVRHRYGREDGLGSIIDFYADHPTALAELQSPALENAVVALIVSKSKIVDRVVTVDELATAAANGVLPLE
jgi:FKBP-type peptidyl-prolyl cis-trans isomerase (trigger factor)